MAVTEGNGNAVGENAGRPYREADMRRDARDEGATQPEVLQLSNAFRRSDGYAWKATGNTPGDPPDAPQGESQPQGRLNGRRKSAEGIVVRWQARLVRHSIRKGEQQIGRSRNAAG